MGRFLSVIAILLALILPVSAYSGITSAQNETVIAPNGACDVTMTIQLELDSVPASLIFPLPGNAADISVNGSYVSASYDKQKRNVDLSGYIAGPGNYSFVIRYHLPDVILAEKEELTLSLELLSGFDHPIEDLSFSITLPGGVDVRPTFTSMYFQDTIETMMSVTQKDNVISGAINQRLQDHETLTMTLPVTAEMFPQTATKKWSMDTVDIFMTVLAGLALLYWLFFMRALPQKQLRRTAVPEGIAAGAIASYLTGSGVDLTMLVISWAQMGYILIQPDDNGRILLHKRMDMGNERSELESRIFRHLFGKRNLVDGTGYHYASCCRKASRIVADAQENFLRRSGNPKVFLFLMLLVGPVSGVSMALSFSADLGWRIVLSILLSIAGLFTAWLMQRVGYVWYSRHRDQLLLGIFAGGIWLGLGIWAGEWNVGLCVVLGQLLTGFAAAFGGRRTEEGKLFRGELLGLRHYLKQLSSEDLKRILKGNPHYYYDLAPYAMALGVDKALSRKLRKVRLPQCPYLTTGTDGHQTAQEWTELLHETADSLDALQKRLPIDRLLGR